MEYNFEEIEKKWQEYWRGNKIYHVEIEHDKSCSHASIPAISFRFLQNYIP